MSILSFLFFGSLLCYALADPVPAPDSPPEAVAGDNLEKGIGSFIADASKSFDENLASALSEVPPENLDYLKNEIIIKGIQELFNYVVALIQDEANPSAFDAGYIVQCPLEAFSNNLRPAVQPS